MEHTEQPGARSASLAEAFEDLAHHVWLCAESWRFYDRIDLALRSPSGSRGGCPGETS
jgi:hypothetical protein